MHKQIAQVGEFQAKFGLDQLERAEPGPMVNSDLLTFRLRFLLEEVEEIAEACGFTVTVSEEGALDVEAKEDRLDEDLDLEKVLDGYVDLFYVALGSIRLHGLHTGSPKFAPYAYVSRLEHAFNRVHAANMSKERATSTSVSKRGSPYDVVKPEGWQPPDLKDLVTP